MPTAPVRHLRIAIIRRGLTYRQFAQLAGLHRNIVYRAARGARVAPETLAKIAIALDRIPVLPGADRVA